MCAINGVTKSDRETVLRMNAALSHRGPDDTRVYEGGSITLGHDRLAIIDLSPDATQPMVSTNGRYRLVFNGEIYNYRELRQTLSGSYSFATQSDTEVLLAAYERWGEAMLSRLRGIFAFALWDEQTETLLLVRDQVGVKPLYFTVDDASVLYFSSELKGILAAKKDATLDTTALACFLGMQYTPAPLSLAKDVEKLRPGHLLRYRAGEMTIKRYYQPGTDQSTVSRPDIYDTIDQAVKRQLVSDRPVGAFISGGLDSSIVLHHMSKHTDAVRTFSVAYDMVKGAESEADKFNADAALAQRTAGHYGATHKTYKISLPDIRSSLEDILGAVDEPIANPTVVAQYLLSKWVREDGVVVALGGDGGDELFGGYTRHRGTVAAYWWQKNPSLLRQPLSKLYPPLTKFNTAFPVDIHMRQMVLKEKNMLGINNEVLMTQDRIRKYLEERYQESGLPEHPVDRFMRVDRETWLADESLARSDRTSMAHGLELRVPLLDLDVVALSDRIPYHRKTWPHAGKRILRNTYRPHLPGYLFHQPKRGWVSPGAKWLRDPAINTWAKEVLSSGYHDGLDTLFDWDELQRLLADHTEHRAYHLYPLWNILHLQVWARKNGLRYNV